MLPTLVVHFSYTPENVSTRKNNLTFKILMKMTIRKITFLLLLFIPVLAWSQDSPKTNNRALKNIKKFTEMCDLTPDQVAQVKQIYVAFRKKRKKINNQESSRQQKAEALSKIKEERKQKVYNLLTPEQKRIMDEYTKKKKIRSSSH